MMARNSNVPSRAGYRSARPITSRSSLLACNARPVHTEGPFPDSCIAAKCVLFNHLDAGEQRAIRMDVQLLRRTLQRLRCLGAGPRGKLQASRLFAPPLHPEHFSVPAHSATRANLITPQT